MTTTTQTWIARQYVSGNWEIVDNETAVTVATAREEAHARLIAKAPQMLAVLRELANRSLMLDKRTGEFSQEARVDCLHLVRAMVNEVESA